MTNERTNRYAVIYEWSGENFGAYVPDLPGCMSVGDTLDEAERNIREAIELYLDDVRESGEPIPPARTSAGYVEIAVKAS